MSAEFLELRLQTIEERGVDDCESLMSRGNFEVVVCDRVNKLREGVAIGRHFCECLFCF